MRARPRETCGLLQKAMYGTRDAAMAWQEEYERAMCDEGMRTGSASPCHFCDDARGMRIVVHGDDFLGLARRKDADRLVDRMGARYSIEVQRIGPRPDDPKTMRVLNRTIRWEHLGLSYEADPKHASAIVKNRAEGMKPVVTPGVADLAGDESPMNAEAATAYRADTARTNYLGIDRPDVQYASKEASRRMSAPRAVDGERLIRIARYLSDPARQRVRQVFAWRAWEPVLEVWTDSDWAGCRETRKSTSGGVVCASGHVVKTWSVSQKGVALSSAEAELYAANKGAAEAMGVQSIAKDFGDEVRIVLRVDSSAAIGIVGRRGLGRLRHVHAQELWLQQEVREGRLGLAKTPGSENVADILTKHVGRDVLERHLRAMGFESVATGAD